jgi:signal transduction histidine kinase
MCWQNSSHLGMAVTDNGTGAVFPLKYGIGITAMEDVINQLDGYISITSGKWGFKISVGIPLSRLPAGQEIC